MKPFKSLSLILMAFLIVSSTAFAGDFNWMQDLNIKAQADPSEFRARLAARFKVGDVTIQTVLDNVGEPADAYMLLRLGEMSNQPIDHVIEKYKAEKGKGWGVLARSLGIKPGSKAFHALKRGQDLYGHSGRDRGKKSFENKGKGKAKGRK